MCMLLKLHYAKFDVSSLFCSKVIEEKSLGGGSVGPPPPLFKGRVKLYFLLSSNVCCDLINQRNSHLKGEKYQDLKSL